MIALAHLAVAGLHLFRRLQHIAFDVSQDRASPRIKESSERPVPTGIGHDLGRRQQKSLEQSLREILAAAAAPSRAELLVEVERIRAKTRPPPPGVRYPSAEEMIREDRDSR